MKENSKTEKESQRSVRSYTAEDDQNTLRRTEVSRRKENGDKNENENIEKIPTVIPDSDNEYKALDANKILNEFGTYGRYQIVSYVLCQITNFFYATSVFVWIFLEEKPKHFTCKIDPFNDYEVVGGNQCKVKNTITGEEYDCGAYRTRTKIYTNESDMIYKLPTEFKLLCANPILQEIGFSIFSLGALIVVPVASQLADTYGRRVVLLVSVYSSFLFNVAVSFAPNYAVFIILRFLVGAASDTYLSVGAILSCETVAESFREWTSLVGVISWILGYTYVGLLDHFIKEWRLFHLLAAFPTVTSLLYLCLLPESPHWMTTHGDERGVKEYIRFSSIVNNKVIDLDKCRTKDPNRKLQHSPEKTLCDIFRKKRLIFAIFVNGYITMAINFYYFVIAMGSVSLSENKLLGYVASGFSEIPGGILVIPLLHFFGRRTVSFATFFLQGTAMLISPFLQGAKIRWAYLACNLFARMVNEISFTSHPLLANEMMPTTIRSVSFAIINIPQSIGIMLSPLLKYTDIGDGMIPCFVLAGLMFIAMLLTTTLPETKGKPMPENVDDFDPGPLLRYFISRHHKQNY